MRKWILTTAVFLGLLALGGVALAQSGCPPEARVSVNEPLCPGDRMVSGRVAGTSCRDAAVTIRHTADYYGIGDKLVGTGRTTANGDFSVPLSETLRPSTLGGPAWIEVVVACPCGPLREEQYVWGRPKILVPPFVHMPQAGEAVISGTWDPFCSGATLTVTDQDDNVIGTGVVQADGSLAIQLLRPLETDEVVFITAVGGTCGFCTTSKDFAFPVGPIPIPESSTLLLLASGLAGLAGAIMVKRHH